ncbi:type II toxin-antitoxin system PemK/MazF family toxin [Solimonas soli]|uniref:type II toxin-antitoxin system PemK/MazF family toxin n=1 Tax=Solimonas soli TaxID=413479 RepID=UPI000488660D|nr:type II toxin-antitoxin system PemK/MazF family toxin [Solimonas soli]
MIAPDVGDIPHPSFDPASGREMKGDHFCIVLTHRAFNECSGLAWTCPIATGKQEVAGGLTAVTLMGTGLKVSGIVLCHPIKALDWSASKASRVDRLEGSALDQILDVCTAIIDPARR